MAWFCNGPIECCSVFVSMVTGRYLIRPYSLDAATLEVDAVVEMGTQLVVVHREHVRLGLGELAVHEQLGRSSGVLIGQ